MTTPPLPESPCVRVRMSSGLDAISSGGNRFYLSYSGAAPTGANCTTLAGDIESAWVTNLAPLINEDDGLQEVDVLDIASDSGLSGQWTGNEGGTRSGTPLPVQCCTNIEFGIARRYRGGKPRMYLFGGVAADLQSPNAWSTTFVDEVNTGIAAFFAEIAGLSIGAMGTLAHVNLSYYSSFKNMENSSGRMRAVPQYKTAATLDTITGYSTKVTIGSQKRRRTSTTP